MPFNDVTNKDGSASTPLESATYLLKVESLEEAEPGQFGPRMKWIFGVAEQADNGSWTPVMVFDSFGQEYPYQLYAWTSDKLSPRATARACAEGFLNRELDEGETGAQISQAMIGCFGLANIKRELRPGSDPPSYKAVIQAIGPFKKGQKVAAPPAKKQEAEEAVPF